MLRARIATTLLLAVPAVFAGPPGGTRAQSSNHVQSFAFVLVIDMARRNVSALDERDVKDAVGVAISDSLRDDFVSLLTVVDPLGPPSPLGLGRNYRQRLVDQALAASDRDRYGAMPLWDAIVRATAVLAARPSGAIPAIIVYSTGQVSGNRLSSDEALSVARDLRIPVSVVFHPKREFAVPQVPTGILILRPDLSLRRLASETTGVFMESPVPYTEGLRQEFKRVIVATKQRAAAKFSQ